MPTESDSADMVLRASSGDDDAVTALLERHLPDLRAFVRLRAGAAIRAKESCSDIVQSVCREVLQDLDGFEFRGEARFRGWLFKRAFNKIVDKNRYYAADKRSPAREQAAAPGGSKPGSPLDRYLDDCSPSRIAIANEVRAEVEAAFDQLPEDYREAILLNRIVGLSQTEVAEEMGRSVGAVRNLVYRGLARLSLMLDAAAPDA